MRPIRELSIRHKMVVVILASGGAALAFAGTAAMAYAGLLLGNRQALKPLLLTAILFAPAAVLATAAVWMRSVSARLTALARSVREAGWESPGGKPVAAGDEIVQLQDTFRKLSGINRECQAGIRAAEENFRSLFENAPDAMLILGAGRVSRGNRKALELLRATEAEAVGAAFWELSPPTQPDGKSSKAEAERLLRAALDGTTQVFEWVLRRRDEMEVDAEVILRRLEIDCEPCVQATVRDIASRKATEVLLRESEEKYRRLFETASNLRFREVMETLNLVAVMLDKEGRLQFCNDYTIKMTGWTLEELQDQNWFDLVLCSEERVKASIMLERLASHSEIPRHTESTIRTRKGEQRLVVWDNAILRDAEGNTLGIAIIGRDMTGEMELEKRLRQAQKVEAIGTLAAGIAHDFNNILGPILGYSELAMMSLPGEDPIQEYQKQIFTAANRAKALVRQILSIGRRQEEDKKPVEIQSVVKEVVNLLREIVPSSIQMKHYSSPVCGSVLADPGQIHQVLMNLCTNAVHAMRDQQGVLEIRLEPTVVGEDQVMNVPGLQSGTYVRLEVIDNGHGMDATTLERIFDPYFTTKEPSHGTGLGLAVVHGIVTGHGGALNVQSHPGMGTTFQVYFPAFGEVQVIPSSLNSKVMRGKGRILLVDDEPALVELGSAMLQHLGYEVLTKTNSVEALAFLKKHAHDFDLVITDQTMPVLTGFGLAREILTLHPRLPFILCTGYSELADRSSALDVGFREFVSKPYTMRDLADAVHRAMQKTA